MQLRRFTGRLALLVRSRHSFAGDAANMSLGRTKSKSTMSSWHSIIIAGCTSNNLSNVYLLSVSYSDNNVPQAADSTEANTNISSVFSSTVGNGTTLEVRAGYLGMCLSTIAGTWTCSRSPRHLVSLVKDSSSSTTSSSDPLNLIYIAERFKEDVVFEELLYISIALAVFCFALLSTFPSWREEIDDSMGSEREVKPFPSKPVSMAALACALVAFLISLMSIFWQHLSTSAAATMVKVLTYEATAGHVGVTAMALGWVSVLLLMTTTITIVVIILSLRALAALVD